MKELEHLRPGAGTAGRLDLSIVKYLRSLFSEEGLLLDVGCGAGDFLRANTVGIDSDYFILPKNDSLVLQGDLINPLPFKDEAFVGVLAKDVIEHLPDPRRLIRELHRVTVSKGHLVVFTPRAIPRAVWADYTHVRGFTKVSIQRLLEDAGWRLLSIRRFGAVPFAGRARIVKWIPSLLSVPGIGHYFGTNWQVIAERQ